MKLFKAIINLIFVGHLNRSNILSDKHYGFRSTRSTADILTYRTSETEYISSPIALDILNIFDKVGYKDITGKVFLIIKSFLIDRSVKVVINGQSTVAQAINAGVLKVRFSIQPSFYFA